MNFAIDFDDSDAPWVRRCDCGAVLPDDLVSVACACCAAQNKPGEPWLPDPAYVADEGRAA